LRKQKKELKKGNPTKINPLGMHKSEHVAQ
jgi:hypothetical protein